MRERPKKTTAATGSPARGGSRGLARGLRYTRWTAIWAGLGLVTAGLGFVLLAREAIGIAPFLLLAAFLVFFPLALFK